MRKVVLTLKESQKYLTIKKLVETNGNKNRAATKLDLSVRQINRLIAGYNEFGKEFFVHGNRGRQPKHALTLEEKDQIEDLYIRKNRLLLKKKLLKFKKVLLLLKMHTLDSLDAYILVKKFKLMLLSIFGLAMSKLLFMLLLMIPLDRLLLHILTVKKL